MDEYTLIVSTIIPTYNEEKNIKVLIPRIIREFEKNSINGRVIVIDDSSIDGTGKKVEEMAKKIKRIHLITRPTKLGIGSAYKVGFKYALSRGHSGVIEIDADLSHDSSFIPDFVKKLEDDYDLVIGSRYVKGGNTLNWPISRRVLSRLANSAVRLLFGLSTLDNTSGFRAYSSHALRTIDIASVKSDGYAFQVEMTVLCQKSRLKVCEIPITFLERSFGESKLSAFEMWKFLKTILQLAHLKK